MAAIAGLAAELTNVENDLKAKGVTPEQLTTLTALNADLATRRTRWPLLSPMCRLLRRLRLARPATLAARAQLLRPGRLVTLAQPARRLLHPRAIPAQLVRLRLRQLAIRAALARRHRLRPATLARLLRPAQRPNSARRGARNGAALYVRVKGPVTSSSQRRVHLTWRRRCSVCSGSSV